jgi:hypothetical protein
MAEKVVEVFGFLVQFWRSLLQRDNMTYKNILQKNQHGC